VEYIFTDSVPFRMGHVRQTGSRADVYHGRAHHTKGKKGLYKDDIVFKNGGYKSKKMVNRKMSPKMAMYQMATTDAIEGLSKAEKRQLFVKNSPLRQEIARRYEEMQG
jgi:hypothetical protein